MNIILIGGFLGSGKTTAVVGASQWLAQGNKKAVVITNDQGNLQVDKEWVRSRDIPVEEVSNGCFCCQHHELLARMEALQQFQPDYLFAESVGSCTDLVATVAKPLMVHKPESRIVISVFADAALLAVIMQGKASFLSENVRYIFQKQLEEADLIVVNKVDLVTKEELNTIEGILSTEYPEKKILFISTHNSEGIKTWMDAIHGFILPESRRTLEIDYDRYADGEAALAWLDENIELESEFADAGVIAAGIMNAIHTALNKRELTIGHLKFFIEGEGWAKKVSFTITQHDHPEFVKLPPCRKIRMIINARIQIDALKLRTLVKEAIGTATQHAGVHLTIHALSVFEPGYPQPTFRLI